MFCVLLWSSCYNVLCDVVIQLLGRFGTIEECGQLCLYLAAERTFCTGIDIPLSAGAELNYANKNRTNAGKANVFA